MVYLAVCFATPSLFLAFGLSIKNDSLRRTLGPTAVMCFLLWLLSTMSQLSAPERLLCCSLWLLYIIKGWSLLKVPRQSLREYSRPGLILFSYLWPGIDPSPFKERVEFDPGAARWYAFGFPTMCVGIAAGLLLAVNATNLSPSALGLAGVLAILTAVHLGYSDVLGSILRLMGFRVTRLFQSPLQSTSLRDFWSKRWNRPFVEMNRLLFQPLLPASLSKESSILALFLLSGILHELALSLPPGAGWGGPLLYFSVQGVAMLAEHRFGLQHHKLRRLWTWSVILLPLPLLFHAPFREALVLPLYYWLHSLPAFSGGREFLEFALTAVAYGHFLVLAASFQVPHRLNWREELLNLRPLNRKLLWTYGCYIATFIFLFGLLTLQLLPEMLAGEKSALALMGLISLFWWSRVLIDAFYFEHSDWPEGVEFVLGHTMLTSLFVTIATTYTATLVWHLV